MIYSLKEQGLILTYLVNIIKNSKNHDIINNPAHYNQGSIEPIVTP
jgi:hypothetical protein